VIEKTPNLKLISTVPLCNHHTFHANVNLQQRGCESPCEDMERLVARSIDEKEVVPRDPSVAETVR
jgi:hypothetical protein